MGGYEVSAPKKPTYERRIALLADDLHEQARKLKKADKRCKILRWPTIILTLLVAVEIVANVHPLLLDATLIAALTAGWTYGWFADDRLRARQQLCGMLTIMPYLIGNPLSERTIIELLSREGIEYASTLTTPRE